MKKTILSRLIWAPALAASFGWANLCQADLLAPARVVKSTHADGKVVQALQFQLQESQLKAIGGTVAHDHIIFFDTSASQVGAHRQHGLAVLDALLRSLPVDARVRLYSIDVGAEPLTSEFAAAKSDIVRDGRAALDGRIPLGATNMEAVARTALAAKDAEHTCSIIYIGDGMSTADLLETKELRDLVGELRNQQIAFHAYGVGPAINLQVLGVLAHQTGGYIDFDYRFDNGANKNELSQVAADRGGKLAAAVERPVFYPTHVSLNSAPEISLPLLPLRSDRETIHVIRGVLPADATVVFSSQQDQSIEATAAKTIEWKLAAPIEQPGTNFLFAIAQQMDQDQGLSNSLAGRGLMHVYQQNFATSMTSAVKFGEQQLKKGKSEIAADVARRVAEIDPTNAAAKTLALNSEKKLRVRPVSQTEEKEEGEMNAETQPDPGASLTRDQEHAIRVKTEKLRNQVNNAIDDARKTDPDSGLVRLKQVDNTVRTSLDIPPEDRLQLRKRLEGEISQLRNASDKLSQDRVQLAEQLSQLEAQKRLAEQLQLEEEKLEGLIDRVRGLMHEGRHGRDEAYGEAQNVADVAINLRPGEGTSAAARFDSEAAQQLNRSYRLRNRRADQFLETLHQVELAHIPFPDEPPVRFPPAEVWKALSERRKVWDNVDLHRDSPVEQKIRQELNATTEVNFTDIPLKDALDFLKETHHINILADQRVLSEAGISVDQQVTLVMSGVSLKSVLRLLLQPLTLTYVIQDEVLKITTAEEAENIMQTRVYPVADLATPIMQMGGGMGGMGGGGMGGMGGGMGGMGGGMGGMGGMGGGMGGMGGGGFFSVPPEKIPQAQEAKPAQLDNNAVQNLKKKLAQ